MWFNIRKVPDISHLVSSHIAEPILRNGEMHNKTVFRLVGLLAFLDTKNKLVDRLLGSSIIFKPSSSLDEPLSNT